MDGIVQVAAWAQYPWLRAGFSTRRGGQTSVYGGDGELNLGWTAEDAPGTVAANRKIFAEAVWDTPLAATPLSGQLVTMRQVHGDRVHVVRRGEAVATPEGKAVLEGDGLITGEPGLLLAAQTADCVPLLLADTRLRSVGALHAGWRGTLARIAEQGVAAMEREFGSQPQDIVAAIGPAIRQCCFEVGTEVADAFAAAFPYGRELATKDGGGKPRLDLQEANRRQFVEAGLLPGAITVVAACSACERSADGRRSFFSYRAEAGKTGRMMSAIGVQNGVSGRA